LRLHRLITDTWLIFSSTVPVGPCGGPIPDQHLVAAEGATRADVVRRPMRSSLAETGGVAPR
jgi:hypothetical protein